MDAPISAGLAAAGSLRFGTMALVAVLAVLAFAVLARAARPASDHLNFLGHIEELRQRLIACVFAVLLGTLFALAFRWEKWRSVWLPAPTVFDPMAAQLLARVADHLVPAGVELVVLRPMDAFMAEFWIALGLGFAIAIPAILVQLGAFFAPALKATERRTLWRAVVPATVLFVVGAAFAYAVVLPITIGALYAFADPIGAQALFGVGDLAAFAMQFMLAFGVAFQLPLILYVLARVGLLDGRSGLRYWRHAIAAIVVLSALLTPDPTLVSQMLMAGPLLVLYFGGLGLARVGARRAKRASAVTEAARSEGA